MDLNKCNVCKSQLNNSEGRIKDSLKLNKSFVSIEERSLKLFNYYYKDKSKDRHYSKFEAYSKNERGFRKWER